MDENKETVAGTEVVEETKAPAKEEKQETKAPAKEPEKTEETKADNTELEEVKKQLAEANKIATQVTELNSTVETLKADVTNKESQLKVYEELLNTMVETKMNKVPEEFKELIPEGLDIVGKLNWLQKAEDKGLFVKEEKKKPNVEIGKPLNPEESKVDTSKMTGTQLLKMAYNSFK